MYGESLEAFDERVLGAFVLDRCCHQLVVLIDP
jgi:hypothetical protein